MELKLILILARRWVWLLAIGLIVGVAGGYIYTDRQVPVYVASTKIMVTQTPRSQVTDVGVINDRDLAGTYIELLTTRPVMTQTSERLGYSVSPGQITARRIGSSGLLEVVVRDTDPQRAADIANEVVQVLIETNETLQSGLFASTEESLQAQIAQVEEQIAALQSNVSDVSEETLESIEDELTAELAVLDGEIFTLQSEIAELEVEIETLTPRAALGEPVPTLSFRQQTLLSEARTELAQKRFQLTLAQDRYSVLFAELRDDTPADEPQDQSSQIQATLALYQQIYSNLLSSYEAVRLARLQNTAHVVQVESAIPSRNPIDPGLVTNLLLGATLGLFATGGIAFIIEYLDDSLKTPSAITRVTGLPVIGRILAFPKERGSKGQEGKPFVSRHPLSVQTEAFHTLHTNLQFAGTEKPLKTILFTSAVPDEGKSTTVLNLATTMIQVQKKVAILDCDLRKPTLHRRLGAGNSTGVGDYLVGELEAEDVVGPWTIDGAEVSVVPSGSLPRHPTELLRSERMDGLLDHLKQKCDFVLIDTPSLVVADAAVLASRVDGVVLVMQPGQLNTETARAVVEQLERVGAHLVGVVMTRVTEKRAAYQDVRYSYQYPNANEGRKVVTPRPRGIRGTVQRIFSFLP